MSAPKAIKHRRVTLSLPDDFLEKLKEYPGEQSTKIQVLCEYAIAMGGLMTMNEAKQLAGPYLVEAIQSKRQVPKLFEPLLEKTHRKK